MFALRPFIVFLSARFFTSPPHNPFFFLLRLSALTGSRRRRPGALRRSGRGGIELGRAGGAPPSVSPLSTVAGYRRSGGNASADSSEVPLTLASVWAGNADAHSATVNTQSTHSQRTVNAQSTWNETALTAPVLKEAEPSKRFFFEGKLLNTRVCLKYGTLKHVSLCVGCALTVR